MGHVVQAEPQTAVTEATVCMMRVVMGDGEMMSSTWFEARRRIARMGWRMKE